MERFAGGVAREADRAAVQRGKEGERWKGVPGPQNADGRAGYPTAARTGRRAVITSSGRLDCVAIPRHSWSANGQRNCIFIHRRQRRELTVLPRERDHPAARARSGLYGLAAGSAARRVHLMSAGVGFGVASAACLRDLPLEDSGKNGSGSAGRQAASVCQFRSPAASPGTSSMVSGAPRIARGWVSPDYANRVIADRDPALTDVSGARLGTRWRSGPTGFRPARPRGRNEQDQAAGSRPPQSRGLGDACSPCRI